MSIPGQQSINVGLPNESINSDSLYTAFTKTEQNFDTLFSCASPFTNFVASTGIGVNSNANASTVTITNTGVTSIVAGTNISINRSNGNVTISATGGGNGGGGITSVGLLPGNTSRLVVTNSPLVAAGNIGIDLATTGITEGTYTNPNVTVDPYGRVVGIVNGPAVGTVTSVGLTAGPGVQVNGGPIQSSGNIVVTNTGVIRLTAGTGIDLSSSNGNVTVSLAGGGIGSVTSVGVYSTSLNVSGSPITTAGNIRIELPPNPATAGTFTAGNLNTSGTLVVTGNANVGNLGSTDGVFTGNVSAGNVTATLFIGTLTTASQPNITSVGTLTSLAVSGNISSGNANLGNLATANFFSGSGQFLSAIQAANVAGTVANAANSLRVSTTLQSTGIYYLPFVSSVATANYGLNSNSSFVANLANGALSATTFVGSLSGAATTAGTVTTNAQPNITSLGTLTSLAVTGNANVGNIAAAGVVASTLSGSLTTASQPNITSVGTLGSLAVTNKVTAGQLQGDGGNISNIQGGNVSGAVASATTSGTVTTNTQPNITSVGTLTGLAVSGNVNFTGSNVTLGSNSTVRITGGSGGQLLSTDGAGSLSWVNQGSVIGGAAGSNTQIQYNALNLLAGSANFTFNYATNVLNVNGNISSNGTIGGATATHLGAVLTTGANTTAGTITGNWSLSPGSRLQSTYADLAEYYEADDVYAWGNVLEFGGSKEVTLASNETTRVAGVVSKNPAYVMNSTCPGLLTAIALQGRVPCKVVGPVHKGDMMVSAGDGYAKASSSPALGSVIGKALENFTGTEGVIEIVVGRL